MFNTYKLWSNTGDSMYICSSPIVFFSLFSLNTVGKWTVVLKIFFFYFLYQSLKYCFYFFVGLCHPAFNNISC